MNTLNTPCSIDTFAVFVDANTTGTLRSSSPFSQPGVQSTYGFVFKSILCIVLYNIGELSIHGNKTMKFRKSSMKFIL